VSDRLPYKYVRKIPSGNPNVIVCCIVGSRYVVSWSESVSNIGNGKFYILLTSPWTGLAAIEFFFLLEDS